MDELTVEPKRPRGRPKGSKSKSRIRFRHKVAYVLTDDKSKWNKTQAKKYAWDQFSWYIRLRDAKKTTGSFKGARCITCHGLYPINKIQAGHFMPGRTDTILFDERGVHAQCYRCNVMFAGIWPAYYESMREMYGQDIINDMLIQWKTGGVSYSTEEFIKIGDRYRAASVMIQMKRDR